MIKFSFKDGKVLIKINKKWSSGIEELFTKHGAYFVIALLVPISVITFIAFYENGLGLAYNDARSHLDIGRRVVEGLKPGLAQLGSVWLPLPHILMLPTIWNNFMWHSGLAGALPSMISFIITGVVIFKFLEELKVGLFGRFVAIGVFVLNLNVLYLQSTAMTELIIMATMTLGAFELYLWHKSDNILNLIKSAAWIMLATLTRYDGWFLLFYASILVVFHTFRRKGYKATEGTYILFGSLAGLGVVLWLLWNLLIFGDPLYFAFGPFSARAQQTQLENAGNLPTKSNLALSLKIYYYAFMYNSGGVVAALGTLGGIILWLDKKFSFAERLASTALIAPFFFNVLALYLGHSVLFIQGLSGDTWFNVRYGMMLMPAFAIYIGYLVHRINSMKYVLVGLIAFSLIFAFTTVDAVTIDDARVGSSQKNVTEVSGWLKHNAAEDKGFVLISAASHDAIIFSSGMPMKRFIHEGTGLYWESATTTPDRWAKWIIMRTNDNNDLTWRETHLSPGFEKYYLVDSFPFADIYELKPEYHDQLNTEPIFGKQR